MKNFGIIQGRLLPPENNHIQEFPNNWKDEFTLTEYCNLGHIEWLVTKSTSKNNPIISEYKKYKKQFDKLVKFVCLDNLIDMKIDSPSFLVYNLEPYCNLEYCKNLTIPLLEDSSLKDKNKRKNFIKLMEYFSHKYPDVNFSFETDLPIKENLEIVLKFQNFYITYDTGNVTEYGYDHKSYIEFLNKKINNVHLKDKLKIGTTIPPGLGDTNFQLIFKTLKDMNYKGPFTLQTCREKEGHEINTIIKHVEYFKDFVKYYE